MTATKRHDAWQSGDSYDAYMGRWSRQIAPRFLDWLGMAEGLDWFEVGCGTGALSAAILAQGKPRSLQSIDPSEAFIAKARASVVDPRVSFQVGDALALTAPAASRDVIVAGLVLNFIPDRAKALAEIQRIARPGATIGFYVWDYPGGGVEFMRAFWQAAAALDPGARDLTEDRRFPFCTRDGLAELARGAGLASVETVEIEIPTLFRDFEDYWHPFTLGSGPAPGYCSSLTEDARARLRTSLERSLPRGADGTIPLRARAWAVRGRVAAR